MNSPRIIVGSSARPFVAKATRAHAAHTRVTASIRTEAYRVMAADQPEFACVSPSEAVKLVQAGVTFLDVRSAMPGCMTPRRVPKSYLVV